MARKDRSFRVRLWLLGFEVRVWTQKGLSFAIEHAFWMSATPEDGGGGGFVVVELVAVVKGMRENERERMRKMTRRDIETAVFMV